MRSFMGLTLGLYPLLLTGCAFVSDSELSDHIAILDIDGDGVPNSEDCDDYDDLRRPPGDPNNPDEAAWADPLWVDIPYDGIDNDCGEFTPDDTTDDGDLVDVDGDGYPGIRYEDYVAMTTERFGITDPEWPLDVSQNDFDCVDQIGQRTLPEGMAADDINPSVINEPPYDGVDQDCAGDNDFDADGDGQMPEFVDGVAIASAVEIFSTEWGIAIDTAAPNAFSDCDDSDNAVYRDDSLDDPHYDGIDQDCDGANDFDQDGDGYFPGEYITEFETFVQRFHPDTAPFGPPEWAHAGEASSLPGDCLDAPHPLIPDVNLPPMVYPGAEDIFYDGIDADCDGANDFDQDADGYIDSAWIADGTFATFVENWSGTATGVPNTLPANIEELGGDCDDLNSNAAPGNLELLFDTEDADCDGDPNSTPFGFDKAGTNIALAWDSPSWPRATRTSAHYIVATTGAWMSLSDRVNPAIALLFDVNEAGYDAERSDEVIWNNISPVNTFEHGSGFDLISNWTPDATPGTNDRFWVAATYLAPDLQGNPLNDRTRVLIREHQYVPATGTYTYELANRVFSWHGFDVDLDLQLDDAAPPDRKLWILACGGGDRETPNGDPVSPTTPERPTSFRTFTIQEPVTTNVALQDVDLLVQTATGEQGPTTDLNDSTACFQEIDPSGDNALLTVCDEAGCESFTGDATTGLVNHEPTPTPNWNTTGVREADVHGDLLIFANATSGVTIYDRGSGSQYDWFAGEPLVSADAMWRDNMLFVVAVIEGTPNTMQVAYGTDPANGPDGTIDLPVFDNNPQFEHEAQGDCDLTVPEAARCTKGRNLDPFKVSLHVDNDRLLVAMSAFSTDVGTLPIDSLGLVDPQDAMGWIFLGFAPPPVP